MMFGARKYANARSASEPSFFYAPPSLGQKSVPRRRETREMCHLATGGKRKRSSRRESQDVFQPVTRYFFHHGSCWRCGVNSSVLVPGAGQPICGKSRGQRTSNDPRKEAARGAADNAGAGIFDEFAN